MNIDQVRELTEEQAKEHATQSGRMKNTYNYYIIDTQSKLGKAILIYNNSKQIFEDCEITHSRAKNIEAELLDYTTKKIFTVEELKQIKGYADFKNKLDFLHNYYADSFENISFFRIKPREPEEEEKIKKYYVGYNFCAYFEKLEELNHLLELEKILHKQHFDNIKNNIEYYKKAVKYEFYNYEVHIGGRFKEAFEAMGLDIQKLTKEQRAEANKIFNKML